MFSQFVRNVMIEFFFHMTYTLSGKCVILDKKVIEQASYSFVFFHIVGRTYDNPLFLFFEEGEEGILHCRVICLERLEKRQFVLFLSSA